MNEHNIVGVMGKAETGVTKGQDVEYAKFTVGVEWTYGGKTGTDWIKCICYDKVAEKVRVEGNEGDTVVCRGSVKTRSYKNQSGDKVWWTDTRLTHIDFFKPKSEDTGTSAADYAQAKAGEPVPQTDPYLDDSDIPF